MTQEQHTTEGKEAMAVGAEAVRPTYLPPGLKLVPFCEHTASSGDAYDLAKALRGPITHVIRKELQQHFPAPRAERLLPDEHELMNAIMRVLTEGFVGDE